jgi:non-canonical purine NTP pyrophosphatase (RdgB/HAM1 family)
MKLNVVFVTSSDFKAKYVSLWLGHEIERRSIDVDEIQSLDPKAVAEHKVKQAYMILKKPVLVEDVSLVLDSLEGLPGTLIKWFDQKLGPEGFADLAARLPSQEATVSALYALYDGKRIHYFEGKQRGTIIQHPRGKNSFGFNTVFVPQGSTKTFGEMDDDELHQFSHRAIAVEKLRAYFDELNLG